MLVIDLFLLRKLQVRCSNFEASRGSDMMQWMWFIEVLS